MWAGDTWAVAYPTSMLHIEKKVPVGRRSDYLFGPVVGGGKLFLAANVELICLNATTLEEVWRRRLRCIPTAFANGCLVVSEHSKANTIGISEHGVELWQEPPPRRIPGEQWLVWRDKLLRLDVRAEVAELPARESFSALAFELPAGGSYDLAGDTLTATTWVGEEERNQTDRVLAFDLVGERLLWDREVIAELRALVRGQESTLEATSENRMATLTGGSEGPLVGSWGAWLFGVDRGSGRVLWTQRFKLPIGRPQISKGRVLGWTHVDVPERPWTEDWLVSIDQMTGKERYRIRLADVDPAFRGYQRPWCAAFLEDLAVFTADDGLVAAFKEETGELVWVKDLKKKLGPPVAYEGRVYFCDNDTASLIVLSQALSRGRGTKVRGGEA